MAAVTAENLARLGMAAPLANELASGVVGAPQNAQAELLVFQVDISALSNGTANGITGGSGHVTATDNGTGDTTFTLAETAALPIVFLGGGTEGEGFLRLSGSPTTSTVRVLCEDDAGGPQDFDFSFAIMVFRNANRT